jgi:choline dehydrogenase-like flavoprotein
MAINSVTYDGRPACIMCPFCVGFACEVKAKGSTADTVIPKAVATGHCELRTECFATEILTDGKGRATGVVYIQNGVRVEQPAKIVVVSCSAMESARLLLNSRSKLFPNGLGNRNGFVGRNLQAHAYSGAYGYFEDESYDGLGPAARIALCDFNHGNEGIRGGAMLANEFVRFPYLFARTAHPPNTSTWGKEHKDRQRKFYKRSIAVQGPVQEIPVFSNGVELDPQRKDRFGMPLLRLTGRRHDEDLRTARFIALQAEKLLRAAGAIETFLKLPGSATSFGQHQAGTCRMGNDPKTSVTNSYCQLHDVDNVFVVDGSVHVTNGGFNPSLTIQAVAYRASEYIVRSLF